MRTKTLLLTAALAAAGVATSMAQGVFSVNTVGYVNVTVKPGFNLVANPLKASNQTIGELFKNFQGGVPAGVRVFKLVGTNFRIATWDDFDLQYTGEGAAEALEPGEGVFVSVPPGQDRVITFVGEVQTQAVNPLPAGFSIKGSEIPITGTVTELGFPQAAGDRIFKYLPAQTKYEIYTYDDFENTWFSSETGGVKVPTLSPGEGVFVSKAAAANWNQSFTIQ